MFKCCRCTTLTLFMAVFLIMLLFQPLQASANTLTVLKPVAGDTLYIGLTYTVEWSGASGNLVSADIIFTDGPMYRIGKTTAGKLTFVVPDLPTTSAFIYVMTSEDGGKSGKSGVFSIEKPTGLQPVIPLIPFDPNLTAPLPSDPIGPLDPINPIIIDPTPIDPTLFRPQAPEKLEVTSVSATQVSMTWTDKAVTENGFDIERKTSGGSFSNIGQVDTNVTAFTDADVIPGTAYTYRVRAYNIFGASGYTNEVTAQVQALVTPPLPGPIVPGPQTPEPPAPVGDAVVMHFYIGNTDYFVNGELHTMDAAPALFEGRTVLPIKYVAEPLGAAIGWDPGPRRVRITQQNRVVDLWIGQNRAEVNGVLEKIDPNNDKVTPVVLPPGRTMLPLKFIAVQLGARVDWDPTQQRVTITYPAP